MKPNDMFPTNLDVHPDPKPHPQTNKWEHDTIERLTSELVAAAHAAGDEGVLLFRVQLVVREAALHTGDAQFDTDHTGSWGAGGIVLPPLEESVRLSVGLALDDALDHHDTLVVIGEAFNCPTCALPCAEDEMYDDEPLCTDCQRAEGLID